MTNESDMPVSVREDSFELFGVEIRCHILDDGRRIIEAESMHRFFDAMSALGPAFTQEDTDRFMAWLRGAQ